MLRMNKLMLLLFVMIPLCLADTDSELLARIEALERRCDKQEVQIRRQHKEFVNSKKFEEQQTLVTSEMKQEVDSLRKLVANNEKHLKAGLTAQFNRNSRFLRDNEETVAFHAVLSGGAHSHYHINQTVVFDQVMLNMGGGYYNQHGIFVTPVDGVYIFSVSVMGISTTDSTMVFIKKNGQEIASAIADGRGAPHDQGSSTVVLRLNTGDEVWVSIERHDDTALWGDGLDSFMGCLITAL